MLIDYDFPDSISTGYEDPLEQFFIPLLRNAISYDIAVGYFTSGWLRDAASGLAVFALNGGKSRWVISPNLNKDDADILVNGYSNQLTTLDYSERSLIEAIRSLKTDTRQELCALIATGILSFRIAEPKQPNQMGDLHAKIGIASDSSGALVGFSGSYNLTSRAKYNWEDIQIFKSWIEPEEKRINTLRSRFDNLWNNKDPSYLTREPSNALIKIVENEAGDYLHEFRRQLQNKGRKKFSGFRDYQLEAIDNWGKNKGRGTFVMATGSGKTITAFGTIDRLISKSEEQKKPLIIVTVLPLKHLLEQWHNEAAKFGLRAIKCYESVSTWESAFYEFYSGLNIAKEGYLMALVTNKTFASTRFQSVIKQIDIDFLLVADEAHNLGSQTYLNSLPENANYRLALSATPERHNDHFGTEKLFEYFGKAVIEFDLNDAIKAEYLCPYDYHFHICYMSPVEYEEYQEIQKRIQEVRNTASTTETKSSEEIQLEGKRADLITRVESKLEKLEELLKYQRRIESVAHTLVYCGSPKGEDGDRHIEKTTKLIGALGIKVRRFTAGESMDDRREILDLFSKKELEVITAIKCLDEGVDVPETKTAYILASTTNPREYIQRRGRVLRKSEGKEKAVIHDFLILPPLSATDESNLLASEIERAREFSNLASNAEECNLKIEELLLG